MGFPCCLLPPSLAPAFLSSTLERMKWCGEGPFQSDHLWSKGLCLPNSLSITLSTVTIHPVREALFWFPSAFFFFFTKSVCLLPTFHLCFHLHFPWPPLLEPCINHCNSPYPPPPPPLHTLLHFSLSLLEPCLCWCNTDSPDTPLLINPATPMHCPLLFLCSLPTLPAHSLVWVFKGRPWPQVPNPKAYF